MWEEDGTVGRIEPPSEEHAARARRRQDELTKPPGSLGRLESLAVSLAAIQRTDHPRSRPRRIAIFAGDHGVTAEGVSPYPSEVTGQMLANFLAGGAAINALAREAEAEIVVVDVGVAHPPRAEERAVAFVDGHVRRGTRDFVHDEAMTEKEMREALEAGATEARRAGEAGVALVGLGEMGIGNSTAASAVTAALAAESPSRVVGKGTGLDDSGVAHKADVVARALARHEPDSGDALGILRVVGGLEMAALTGFCLEAAARRLAIVVDGFITTAAFALAWRLAPDVKRYAFFSHRSPEPGHRVLLELLGAEPLLDLQMHLGEGTGAALAMPILGAAVAAHNEMATFADAGVSGRNP